MASICLRGTVCAALLAFASTAGAQTTRPAEAPPESGRATAATVWNLRSGLNVAALACRGADEGAIVAGYNRLLADHRAELAGVYQIVARQYGSPAAFDAAMTRVYNIYAQPASQVALCANVLEVLDQLAGQTGRPLGDIADAALARLEDRAPTPPGNVMTQVAVVASPPVLDQRYDAYQDRVAEDDGILDDE